MDPYKYEFGNRVLSIRQGQIGHTDEKLVGITAKDQQKGVMTFVKAEDAPAVALAILEAAGIDESTHRDGGGIHTPESRAVGYLQAWQAARNKRAEREAEDAKVRAYFEAKCDGPLPEAFQIFDSYRTEYRRARDFFQGES